MKASFILILADVVYFLLCVDIDCIFQQLFNTV